MDVYKEKIAVETDTLRLLDDNSIKQMESVYGKFFMQKDIVWLIDRSAINRKIYLNELKKHATVRDEGFVSSVLYEYYPDFIEQICYYPEEQFRDGFHFGGEWTGQERFNEKIKEMYKGTKLVESLQFE